MNDFDASAQTAPRAAIGVFDSGVGGLSVLDALIARFPGQTFHYLGDTRHMPYGEKTPDALLALIAANMRWLRDAKRAERVVFACNSSTAVLSVRDLPSDARPWPSWSGPVQPACREAVRRGYRRVATLATPTTAKTSVYGRTLRRLCPTMETLDAPAPGLADCVERGETRGPAFRAAMKDWLRPIQAFAPDALILGCTHYPFVRDAIAAELPGHVALLDPAPLMAEALADALGEGASASGTRSGRVTFSVTGDPESFAQVARQLPLAGLVVGEVARVTLSDALSSLSR